MVGWGFFTLGSILGPILGTYIAEILRYEYAFYFSSALMFAGAIFFTLSSKLDGKAHVYDGERIGIVEGFRDLLKISNIRFALTLTLLMYISLSSINSRRAQYLKRGHRMDADSLRNSTSDSHTLNWQTIRPYRAERHSTGWLTSSLYCLILVSIYLIIFRTLDCICNLIYRIRNKFPKPSDDLKGFPHKFIGNAYGTIW